MSKLINTITRMTARTVGGWLCCVMISLTTNVSAGLISLSNAVVYDDVAELYWISELGYLISDDVEYARQLASEVSLPLIIDGEKKIIDTWEVAKRSDIDSLLKNVNMLSTMFEPSDNNWESWFEGTYQATLYNGWFDNGQDIASLVGVSESFWYREEASSTAEITYRETWTILPGVADDFRYVGLWGSYWTYGSRSVWACSTGLTSVKPVPEPSIMLLFGTGLAGLVGAKLRRNK